MSKRNDTDEIRRLRAEAERLHDLYHEAKTRLHEAEIAAATYKVGEVCEARSRHHEPFQAAIVRAVETNSWGDDWYRVSFRKKDGEWSAVERRIYGESDMRKVTE